MESNGGLKMEDQAVVYERALGAAGLPAALQKAHTDQPFDYAIGLKCGMVVYFEGCDISPCGRWLHLSGIRSHNSPALKVDKCTRISPFTFERGLDVLVQDIAWAADAPYGS